MNGCCTFPAGFQLTTVLAISLSAVGLLVSISVGSFFSWFTGIVAVTVISTLSCIREGSGILAIVGAVVSFLTFLLMLIGSIYSGVSENCLYGKTDDDCPGFYFVDHRSLNLDDDDFFRNQLEGCWCLESEPDQRCDFYYLGNGSEGDDIYLYDRTIARNDDSGSACVAFSVVAGLGSLIWLAPGILCIMLLCKYRAGAAGRKKEEDHQVHDDEDLKKRSEPISPNDERPEEPATRAIVRHVVAEIVEDGEDHVEERSAADEKIVGDLPALTEGFADGET